MLARAAGTPTPIPTPSDILSPWLSPPLSPAAWLDGLLIAAPGVVVDVERSVSWKANVLWVPRRDSELEKVAELDIATIVHVLAKT